MPDKELTVKQKKWLDAYVETGNATEAARRAGYKGDNHVLANIGYENVIKLDIPVAVLLDRMGFDDGALIKKLEEGLGAELVEVAKFEGRITDERSYVDYGTRLRYLETILRLKGKFLTKVEHSGTVQQITTVEVVKEMESDGEAESAGAEWESIEI